MIYIVQEQHECDDRYYPMYDRVIGVFKSKEAAIEYTRSAFERMQKFLHNDEGYYVEEVCFNDEDNFKAASVVFYIGLTGEAHRRERE